MTRQPKVMAVASAGGHLVQLLRLMPAWDGFKAIVVTTDASYEQEVIEAAVSLGQALPEFAAITEANRWQKLRLLRSTVDLILLLLRFRPSVVLTTGAAPGYIALRLGALAGLRTVWVDSMANSDELSLSGKLAGKHADLWLTQWRHLSRPEGPQYRGAVV